MENLMTQISEMQLRGDEKGALETIKEAYRRQPYFYKMMDFYCGILELCCPDSETWKNELAPEINRVAQLILEDCTDYAIRQSAYSSLYNTTDYVDGQLRFCENFSSGIPSLKEMYVEGCYDVTTDEDRRLRRKNMLMFLWWFEYKISDLCGRWQDGSPNDSRCGIDTCIDVLEMRIAIRRCIFRNGDFNEFVWNMAANCCHLAEAYLKRGDGEQGLSALEEMAHFSVVYESCPEHADADADAKRSARS